MALVWNVPFRWQSSQGGSWSGGILPPAPLNSPFALVFTKDIKNHEKRWISGSRSLKFECPSQKHNSWGLGKSGVPLGHDELCRNVEKNLIYKINFKRILVHPLKWKISCSSNIYNFVFMFIWCERNIFMFILSCSYQQTPTSWGKKIFATEQELKNPFGLKEMMIIVFIIMLQSWQVLLHKPASKT